RLRLSSSVYSLLFLMILPQPRSTLFPYTTLFRSSGQRTSSPSEAGSRTRSINSDTRTNSSSKGKLMKLPRRQFLHLAAGAAALPAAPRIADAQAYPTRPVRIIVAVAAGSAMDILARLISQWLSQRLGQQFVIENRPGGGNNIGTEAAVRAPADGYTLLMVNTVNAINATL